MLETIKMFHSADVPTVGLDQDSYTAYESAGYLRVCATAFVDGFVGSFTVSLSSTDISAIGRSLK